MMADPVIEQSVEIMASPASVWRVFTDPSISKQMGGEYVTDWKVGSSFGWRGQHGKMLTRGIILQIEPEELLQHNLFALDDPGGEEGPPVLSVVSYTLHGIDARTVLIGREEFTHPLDDQSYADASEGWQMALNSVKALAEK